MQTITEKKAYIKNSSDAKRPRLTLVEVAVHLEQQFGERLLRVRLAPVVAEHLLVLVAAPARQRW